MTKSKRFDELVEEIKKLYEMKNADYSEENDSLSNFKLSEKFGIPAWIGCLIRISDKFSRICQLATKSEPSVKSETIIDTLKDLATYSLICIELYEQWQGAEANPT